MNQKDYDRWEEHLIDTFPSVAAWLQQQTENVRYNWAKSLRSVGFDDACEAVDRMLSGVVDVPKHPQDYPRLAAIEAHRLRRDREEGQSKNRRLTRYSMIAGEQTVKCLLCQDCGCRFVWHSVSMHDALEDRDEIRVYAAAVACSCEEGDRHLKSCNNLHYDPAKMLLYPSISLVRGTPEREVNVAELREFVANLKLQTYAFT